MREHLADNAFSSGIDSDKICEGSAAIDPELPRHAIEPVAWQSIVPPLSSLAGVAD
ncbi:Hypothetical protein PMT_2349 [Prochlorococcus marinus str. MIT 9313]|uniref:Uncharacterized protein n=1 Tax=Prochlorococcus marinus (strain MIT 9313) TaxID=74547 RepID=B9ERH1_PROMM|nr:Hypothetical protein PMT_2349 [Prochlorococcus marinus str. MIT 9313]